MEGKIVLLVGEGGPLGVTLQCLIERSGMVALKSHWTSKNLKSQVGFDWLTTWSPSLLFY